MTDDELKLIIEDCINARPETLNRKELASVLASIAGSFGGASRDCFEHLEAAALLVLLHEKENP